MEKCPSGRVAQRMSWTRWLFKPNWFESLFVAMSCSYGDSNLPFSSDVPGVWSFLNALKYNYINKIQKNLFCPDDVSPGKVGGWDMNEPTSELRT
jgi:hypothetical protein